MEMGYRPFKVISKAMCTKCGRVFLQGTCFRNPYEAETWRESVEEDGRICPLCVKVRRK